MVASQSQLNFDDPLPGLELTALQSFIARRIRVTSSGRPVQIREIVAEAKIQGLFTSDRRVKEAVRILRKDFQLPILARREKPFGYFWCSSVAEMKDFIEMFSSQYRDEAFTLGRLVRSNYPELAGQLRLLIEAVND